MCSSSIVLFILFRGIWILRVRLEPSISLFLRHMDSPCSFRTVHFSYSFFRDIWILLVLLEPSISLLPYIGTFFPPFLGLPSLTGYPVFCLNFFAY